MKYVIITQIKNQEDRVYDWIKYHHEQGFDSFVIFDDFSEDGTVQEIKKAENELNINLILNNTDGIGGTYNIDNCKNSESYGHDSSFHDRICRSYTKANQIVKDVNPEAICVAIDVDEFLISDSDQKLTTIIENYFNSKKCKQILVFNFDVKHDYNLEKGFLYKNSFTRWDYNDLDNDETWKTRCKSIVISKHLDKVTFVHYLINPRPPETYECREYMNLRMLHFRIPNLNSNNIKFVNDQKMDKIFVKK